MKTKLFIVVIAVTVLAALAVAGLAFAQDTTPPNTPYAPYGGMMGGRGGYGMMGGYGGYGMMGGYGEYGPMHEYMLPAFADALGMTPEELQARLDGGETMWDVAQAEGLSEQEIYDLMESAHEQALDQAVEAGVLTQEQADWMDEHMDQMHGVGGAGFAPGGCHGTGATGTSSNQTARPGRWNNQGSMSGMMSW